MKILFITTSFNGLSQRAWVELDRLNHQVSIHLVSTEKKMEDAVDAFQPDLIVAPFLKSPIPEVIWKRCTCFIIHPGIPGDRGACSLDWAILNNEKQWGVTIVQATGKMDSGPVWSSMTFTMRNVSKSILYRHEVTHAAMTALLDAVQKFEANNFLPTLAEAITHGPKGKWNRSTTQQDFRFSWTEETAIITRKINAADSYPGAPATIFNEEYCCFGAIEDPFLHGPPGAILGKRDNAVCIATVDAALWIQCLRRNDTASVKLPAVVALGESGSPIPSLPLPAFANRENTFLETWYEESNDVGYLYFDCYNGAMSTEQCHRLREAFIAAKRHTAKVIVLMGGADCWSNGIHLNLIEAAENPAQTAWENINAIDDLIKEIICTDSHYVISALRGNAGAGGVSLALAADKVIAKKGIIFNPHTRNMGLYGSEYWTYLLPRRIGDQRAQLFAEQCLPWGTDIALEVKLIDDCIDAPAEIFMQSVQHIAEGVAHLSYFHQLLAAKKIRRKRDEHYKPLQKFRDEELEKMYKNFFDDDWGFDAKRYYFVHKINAENPENRITGKDLFSERRKIWRRRKYEKLFYEQ